MSVFFCSVVVFKKDKETGNSNATFKLFVAIVYHSLIRLKSISNCIMNLLVNANVYRIDVMLYVPFIRYRERESVCVHLCVRENLIKIKLIKIKIKLIEC